MCFPVPDLRLTEANTLEVESKPKMQDPIGSRCVRRDEDATAHAEPQVDPK